MEGTIEDGIEGKSIEERMQGRTTAKMWRVKSYCQDVEREELQPRCGEGRTIANFRCGEGRTIAKMWRGKNDSEDVEREEYNLKVHYESFILQGCQGWDEENWAKSLLTSAQIFIMVLAMFPVQFFT